MGRIYTVLGDISPDELGFCQSHEHLSIDKGYPASIFPDQCIDDSGLSAQELQLYRKAGGKAVVDAQPAGACRNAAMLEEISRKSGVNIIASTGFHKMLFYPDDHWVYAFNADKLTRLYIDELTKGMYINCDAAPPAQSCNCLAGQIKTALDSRNLTAQYQKLFCAAAAASIETAAPLMIHIEAGSDPLLLDGFLESHGVLAQKRIYCHLDRAVHDIDVHKELCRRGCFVEYDTIARPKYHSDEAELNIIKQMRDAGFEKNILLGLDTTNARMKAYGAKIGLDYILKHFIPLAAAHGISAASIQNFMVSNAAEAFAW